MPLAMPLATPTHPQRAPRPKLLRLTPEQRVYPRVAFSVGGRFMLEDRTEYAGTTIDGSVRNLSISTEVRGRVGERIVGYFDTIGRVEGTIERQTEEGFVIEIQTTLRKRDKLASQLTWLANREVLNLPEDRRHDRIIPRDPRIAVRLTNAPEVPEMMGHLIDISHGGAAVSISGAFSKGDEIILGTTPARVVRAFDGGVAVEFRAPIPEAMFKVDIKL
jgi:PilZ domain